MKACKLAVAVLALLAVFQGSTPEAGAGADAVGRCETANPSGTPIRITALSRDVTVIGQTVTVNNLSVLAEFGGTTYGPFSVPSGSEVSPVLSAVDAGCAVFNELGLSVQILSAIGLSGTGLNFTKCSFIGASRPECRAPAGTIQTPLGWIANEITGYVAR